MVLIARRLERYRLLYTRKIINGDAPNCSLNWYDNIHKGILFDITYSPNNATDHVKGIRLNSYQVQGPELFNMLPKHL